MDSFTRTVVAGAILLGSVAFLHAQLPTDPSGHWEGSIEIPGTEVRIEVDLARNDTGAIAGTVRNPGHKGFPLAAVALKGQSISFSAREDQPFEGVLSADGHSISGTTTLEGFSLPFLLTRTGDARIEAPTRSAAISRQLEGTWSATVDLQGRSMRFVLMMSNQPDGTATGTMIDVDEGGLKIPVTITETASHVIVYLEPLGSSYSGELNREGTELVGTFSEETLVVPLTFRRAAPSSTFVAAPISN